MKIGLKNFENDKIKENLDAVVQAVLSKKPESIKGKYFKKGYLKSTMGVAVPLDLSQYQLASL